MGLLFRDGLVVRLGEQGLLTACRNAVFEKGKRVAALLAQRISPIFGSHGIGDCAFEDGQGILAEHQAGHPDPIWRMLIRVRACPRRLDKIEEMLNQQQGIFLGTKGLAFLRRFKRCVEWVGRGKGPGRGRGGPSGCRLGRLFCRSNRDCSRRLRGLFCRLNRYATQREILLPQCVIWITVSCKRT